MSQNVDNQAKLVTYKKGEVIFQEGDEEKILYKVLSGKVGIYANYGKEQQREMAILEKDQCFGEMAILENSARSATAISESDTLLMSYPEEIFGLFIAQNTVFFLNLLKNLSLRLRNTNKEVEEMHRLLLQHTQEPKPQKIDLYLRQHTTYDSDGTPHFTLFM